MVITFPHLGNTYFAAKSLFDSLGIEYVIPPKNNKDALEIGSLYSPEDICLPFKIMIGNYIQSIEKGADTVIITGSCGPCRFGEYCELQMKILKKLGKNLNFIVLDMPSAIGYGELLRRGNMIFSASTKNALEKATAFINAYRTIRFIDKVEARAHELSGYEKNKGECKRILMKCKDEAFKSNSSKSMLHIFRKYMDKLNKVEVLKNKNPIRVAIIGEIYTIIEPFSNLYIEDKLMDYGVSTRRMLTPSWWFDNMLLSTINLDEVRIKMASKKYLPLCVGGHARECIGEAVLSKRQKCDGAIQIFPVGCMPEIVSKSILPTISKDEDLPIMTLVVDEMTGEAGYLTRIEAFLDLLQRRKEKSELSWN